MIYQTNKMVILFFYLERFISSREQLSGVLLLVLELDMS